MNPIHFRFTHSTPEDLDRLKHFVVGHYKPHRWISVLEKADEEVPRDHTHSVVYVNVDKKEFSKQVRKAFPMHKGNRAFSVFDSIEDPVALEQYVCKGEAKGLLPTVLETNFTPEEITTRHLAYWAKNEELKKNIKPKKALWSDRVFDEALDHFKVIEVLDQDTSIAITKFILARLGKDHKKFGFRLLQEMTLGIGNALLLRYGNQKTYDNWAYDVAHQVYHQTSFLGREL